MQKRGSAARWKVGSMNRKEKAVALLAAVAVAIAAYNCYPYFERLSGDRRAGFSWLEVRRAMRGEPDHVVLTPAFDLSSSVAIAWRTSTFASDGVVQFGSLMDGEEPRFEEKKAERIVPAFEQRSRGIAFVNHSVVLRDLLPGASYRYRVGSRERDTWSEYRTFSTAPESSESFAFIYVGDTQMYPERVRRMLSDADRRHPETEWYMIGGDLVDNGNDLSLWNAFFVELGELFSCKPVAPVMGNHDHGFQSKNIGQSVFNAYFTLSDRDGKRLDGVANYGFRRGNAYFIMLQLPDVGVQTEWLEKELRVASESGFDFITVMFHHPVYNVYKGRSNPEAEELWVPLFDKYGVDLVLSGHDHSYMRSKRLRGGRPVAEGEPGTTYVVATGCEKFYDFVKLDIAETQFTNTATYQLIVMKKDADGFPMLVYQARDASGKIVDEFTYVKR